MSPSYQERVARHVAIVTKGDPTDIPERRDRFGEESLEVQQGLGQTRAEAHALVDYVYDRPAGHPRAEIGGALYTLAALASEAGYDLAACGEDELARLSEPAMIQKIQKKRAGRRGRGPLPGRDARSETPAAMFAEGAAAFAAGLPLADAPAGDGSWAAGWSMASAHAGAR